jgi:hypothetical protein
VEIRLTKSVSGGFVFCVSYCVVLLTFVPHAEATGSTDCDSSRAFT